MLLLLFVALILKTLDYNQRKELTNTSTLQVVLNSRISDLDKFMTQKELSKLDWVSHLEPLTKEQILVEIKTNTALGVTQIAKYTDSLLNIKGISKIIYPRSLNKQAIEFTRNLKTISNATLITVALVCLLFAFLIIKALLYSKKHTIYYMKLIGATPTYTFKTFLKPIFWCSLAAGLFSSTLVSIGLLSFIYFDINLIKNIDVRFIGILVISLPIIGIIINEMHATILLNRLYKMNKKQINSI